MFNHSKFKPLIFISGIYLLLIIIFALADLPKFKEMNPNEWGDFWAGTFAPLAFLWLVFGYYQQGEELKQNTAALKLQYRELANSVEQQKLLVETTQADLELTKNKELRQISLDTIEAQPFFHFEKFDIYPSPSNQDGTSNGMLSLECLIKNSRAICRNVDIIIQNINRSVTSTTHLNYLDNDLELNHKITLYLPYGYEFVNNDSFDIDIKIKYFDAYDEQQFQTIQLTISRDYSQENLSYDYEYLIKNKSFKTK